MTEVEATEEDKLLIEREIDIGIEREIETEEEEEIRVRPLTESDVETIIPLHLEWFPIK